MICEYWIIIRVFNLLRRGLSLSSPELNSVDKVSAVAAISKKLSNAQFSSCNNEDTSTFLRTILLR